VDIGIRLVAIITAHSFQLMQLKVEQEIWCIFKASSVQIIN